LFGFVFGLIIINFLHYNNNNNNNNNNKQAKQ